MNSKTNGNFEIFSMKKRNKYFKSVVDNALGYVEMINRQLDVDDIFDDEEEDNDDLIFDNGLFDDEEDEDEDDSVNDLMNEIRILDLVDELDSRQL